MPKIDPETQALYDEINGMIQKFKVTPWYSLKNYKTIIPLHCYLNSLGWSKGEGGLHAGGQMRWHGGCAQNTIFFEKDFKRSH